MLPDMPQSSIKPLMFHHLPIALCVSVIVSQQRDNQRVRAQRNLALEATAVYKKQIFKPVISE